MYTRLTLALALVFALAACDGDGSAGGNVNLDSAGSKLGRGMEKVGNELDTAWTNVKTEMNEGQVEAILGRLNGMEQVEAEMTPDGKVRLTGSVQSDEQRQFAEKLVSQMKGVTSVTNEIAIAIRPDSAAVGSDTLRLVDTTRK